LRPPLLLLLLLLLRFVTSLLLPLLLLLQQHQCFCDAETAMEVAGTLSTACCCRLERQTQRTLRVLLHLFR